MSISEKLTTIAENEQKVHQAGKDYQNELLWSAITNDGTRTDYSSAFRYGKWDKNSFLPTYDITPTNASYMFYQIGPNGQQYEEMQVDMEELEKSQGIKFDFSKCKSFYGVFAGKLFSVLNVIDMTSASGEQVYVFYGGYGSPKLKRINRLILSESVKPHSTWFGACYDLTHIGFDGVLAQNGLDVSSSISLDKESIISLVNILSETTSGLTIKLSKLAVNNAFGIDIDDETTYPEGSEFYALRNTKSNWTFNYA